MSAKPTTKEALTKAQALIRSKRYKEARVILKRLDHPTAKLWLARLDTLDPEFDDPFATTPRPVWQGLLLAAVPFVAAIAAVWFTHSALITSGADANSRAVLTAVMGVAVFALGFALVRRAGR